MRQTTTMRGWVPGFKSFPGRWEGTDIRLGSALDSIILDGCVEQEGDVEGPGAYSLVPFSHREGGYIVRHDSYGFRTADRFDTKAGLDKAWAEVVADVTEWESGDPE